jgi:hypothetical protein
MRILVTLVWNSLFLLYIEASFLFFFLFEIEDINDPFIRFILYPHELAYSMGR